MATRHFSFLLILCLFGSLPSSHGQGSEDTAAFLIGGYYTGPESDRLLKEVEIFGCDGPLRAPAELPNSNYMMGARYMEDDSGDGYILACGGTQCEEACATTASTPTGFTSTPATTTDCALSCDASVECYEFRPADNEWVQSAQSMNRERFAQLMATMDDPDDPEEEVILALGGAGPQNTRVSEYLDPVDGWTEYETLPDQWTTLNCMVQHQGIVYYIDANVNFLIPETWDLGVITETVEDARELSKCALIEIDNEMGIFTRSGWWFNLVEERWESKTIGLPTPATANLPNELFSYGGKPTIFGAPRCDALNVCTFDDVIQFDTVEEEWTIIGSMVYPRRFQEMIEVPKSFCDPLPEAEVTTTAPPVTDHPVLEDTVAVLIGGYSSEGTDQIGDIEVFGCGGPKRIAQLEGKYLLMGATYIDHVRDGQYILACGGREQIGANFELSPSCFELRLDENRWHSVPPLQEDRYAHLMAQVPLDGVGEVLWPLAVGFIAQSEIRNPVDYTWSDYELIPDRTWITLDCLIQYDLDIYHIDNSLVTGIEPETWNLTVLGTVPAETLPDTTLRCAGVEIGGVKGIFTRRGQWFNLETRLWEEKTPMPLVAGGDMPNSMFQFQGRPTVFGAPQCNSLSECTYDQVLQYVPETNDWINLGAMSHPRRLHEVVEVPASFCDMLNDGLPTTTEPADVTLHPGPGVETAALIVGGYNYQTSITLERLITAEVVGCDGGSRYIETYPNEVLSPAGTYIHDDLGGYVLMCGGVECPVDANCFLSQNCYQWRPDINEWIPDETMGQQRFQSILAQVPDRGDFDTSVTYPVILGFQTESEILRDSGWAPYESIPARDWLSLECFLQFRDKIYHVSDDVIEIDPLTWEFSTLGITPLPNTLASPLKCAGTVIDGDPGLFTRLGNFFNLRSYEWEAYRPPPVVNVADVYNAMWGYQGKPTIFGAPECNALDDCLYNKILQYDPDDNDWSIIGTMMDTRRLHEVVEIPKSFCDLIPPTTVAPDTTPTMGATSTVGPFDETAAVLIGGFYTGPQISGLSSLEIFGCDGMTSRIIDSAPSNLYLSGSAFVHDDDGGYILICGGTYCEGECDYVDECYTWRPNEMLWEPTSFMNRSRFNHIMAQLPVKDSGDPTTYPVALGYWVETEMLDPVTQIWSDYESLPDRRWVEQDCLIQFQSMVYHLGDDGLQELDPTTWTITPLTTEVPEEELGLHKCAGTFINGDPGIFTQSGNFYNFNLGVWEVKAELPEQTDNSNQNSMWTFRGRPTIFGAPFCTGLNECFYDQVIQYVWEDDEWVMLGEMREPRRLHEMVEVPRSFCNILDGITTSTPTTTGTTTTTTEGVLPDTASLIIGGYLAGPTSGILSDVEVFGCDGGPRTVAPLPYRSYVMGAAFVHDDRGGHVLACGGAQCVDGQCGLSNRCYQWWPEDDDWVQTDTLLNVERYGHLLAQVPNIYNTTGELLPTVIGSEAQSEILYEGEWLNYESIPNRDWNTQDCFIQYKNKIYHIKNGVVELDPTDWSFVTIAGTPEDMRDPRKCAGTVIDNSAGIFTRDGYWFNLRTRNWEQREPMPDNCAGGRPNAMWGYQGKPTIFGAANCDGLGECYFQDVIQYQPEQNEWTRLGEMLLPRRMHEVVEIPKTFCDVLDQRTTTTWEPGTDSTWEPGTDSTGEPDTGATEDPDPTGPTDDPGNTDTTDDDDDDDDDDDGAVAVATSLAVLTVSAFVATIL